MRLVSGMASMTSVMPFHSSTRLAHRMLATTNVSPMTTPMSRGVSWSGTPGTGPGWRTSMPRSSSTRRRPSNSGLSRSRVGRSGWSLCQRTCFGLIGAGISKESGYPMMT